MGYDEYWNAIDPPSDGILTAINVVLAFCMGNDIEGILASPIGQPMATVSALIYQSSVPFLITRADLLQQLWSTRYPCDLVCCCVYPVRFYQPFDDACSDVCLSRFLMGNSMVSLAQILALDHKMDALTPLIDDGLLTTNLRLLSRWRPTAFALSVPHEQVDPNSRQLRLVCGLRISPPRLAGLRRSCCNRRHLQSCGDRSVHCVQHPYLMPLLRRRRMGAWTFHLGQIREYLLHIFRYELG